MQAKVQTQPQSAPIFKLVKWNVIASWASDGTQGNCDICKNELTSICIDCIAKNDPNLVCNIEEGACRHAFHKHCLDSWFKTTQNFTCLLCKVVWNPLKTKEIKKQN